MRQVLLGVAALAVSASANAQKVSLPLLGDMDTNQDGYVIESEFVAFRVEEGVPSTDAVIEFIALDLDGSGAISPSEWNAASGPVEAESQTQSEP